MEPLVLETVAGGVGRLTFNRPAQRNAMSPDMMALFYEKLKVMNDDPAIRCIVVDGAGGNFIAGGDVKSWARLHTMTPAERGDDFRERMAPVRPLVNLIGSMDKPLIVAVKGFSAGAGITFVLSADFVIADDTAKFLFANVRMSLIPDMGITYWLPRVVGAREALRLTLLGSQVDATQAKDLGIVSEVVTPDGFEAAIAELTAKIIAMPARAILETKKLLRLSRHGTLSEQFDAEVDGLAVCAGEDDFLEAVTAFAERRPAKFGGAS